MLSLWKYMVKVGDRPYFSWHLAWPVPFHYIDTWCKNPAWVLYTLRAGLELWTRSLFLTELGKNFQNVQIPCQPLFTQASSSATKGEWKVCNPCLSLNHDARCLFRGAGIAWGVRKVSVLHSELFELQCKQIFYIHRDQDRGWTTGTSPPVPAHPRVGCNDEPDVLGENKGQSISFGQDGLCRRLSPRAPGPRFPVAWQVRLSQLSSLGHSFSTRVVHQSRKSGWEGFTQTSALFLHISTEATQKEPGGGLGGEECRVAANGKPAQCPAS